MKLKGVGPFERHVEKLVLGVVGLVFLLVLAMQFLGGGNTVEIQVPQSPAMRVAPDRIYEPIEERARSLLAAMNDPSPVLPEAPSIGLVTAWEAALAVPVVPTQTITALGPVRGPGASERGVDAEVVLDGDVRFAALSPPAPGRPRAVFFRGTLSPLAVVNNSGLRAMVPAQQPFDVGAVSVEASFDGHALREALTTASPDGRYRPIPVQWWRDQIAILSVDVERCEGFDERGEPINRVLVEHLPGREPLLARLGDEPPGVEAFRELVDEARDEARRIVRPAFYPTIAGPRWMAPSDLAKLEQIESRRAEIGRQVARAERIASDIEELQRQLAEARRGGTGPARPPMGEPGRDAPPSTPSVSPAQIRTWESRLERLQLDLERVRLELEYLGVDITGEPIVGRGEDEDDFLDDLLETSELRLIAHDIRVEPGREYHYRVRVRMNNPLFGHGQQLTDDQRQLATRPIIVGPWSAWSEPVGVDQNEYFFVTAASMGDAIGGPRATVEVYRFYYGYWRRASVPMEPGDALQATIRLPDPRLLPVFDLAKLAQAPQEPPGGLRDPFDRGRTPGMVIPGVDDPSASGGEIRLPTNAEPGRETLDVSTSVVLLDVATVPGGTVTGIGGTPGRAQHQAYLRGGDGRVIARSPRLDTGSRLYERLVASSREGQRQGMPEPTPEEPDPASRQQPRERQPPPPPPPSGGGGGG